MALNEGHFQNFSPKEKRGPKAKKKKKQQFHHHSTFLPYSPL
jgi:hypothetical protein